MIMKQHHGTGEHGASHNIHHFDSCTRHPTTSETIEATQVCPSRVASALRDVAMVTNGDVTTWEGRGQEAGAAATLMALTCDHPAGGSEFQQYDQVHLSVNREL